MGEQVGQGCGTTLRDPAVMAFVRSAVEVAEPYEAFCGRPLPSGLSREDAWELVTFSRRLSGWPSVMGDPADPLGGSYWTVPRSIVPHLVDTVQKTGASSRLWEELRRLERQPVVTRVLLEDVQAACLRDGLDVEYERLRAVVVHGEAPLLPEERVVSNLVGLVRDLPGSRRDTGSLSGLIGTAIHSCRRRLAPTAPGRSASTPSSSTAGWPAWSATSPGLGRSMRPGRSVSTPTSVSTCASGSFLKPWARTPRGR